MEDRHAAAARLRDVVEDDAAHQRRREDDARKAEFDIRHSEKNVDAAHVPITLHLARVIRATPAKGLAVIADERGRPITAGSLGRRVKRAAKLAGLPERCTAHGLRKSGLRLLAELGGSTKQLQSVSGHKSLQQLEGYIQEADQAVLARSAVALSGTKKHQKVPNPINCQPQSQVIDSPTARDRAKLTKR
jgi:integrase